MIRHPGKKMELAVAARAGGQIACLENINSVLHSAIKGIVYAADTCHIRLKRNKIYRCVDGINRYKNKMSKTSCEAS